MKKTTALLLFVLANNAFAQISQKEYEKLFQTNSTSQYESYLKTYRQQNPVVYQQGYYKDNGAYVQPHYKTKSNETNWDNFSTQGNVNPYTLQYGTVAPDYSIQAQNYGQGKTIYTGPKGGQYYINSNGRKTYVPKRSY